MKKIQSNIEEKINAYISDNKVTGMVCDHLLSNLNQDGDYWWYLEDDGDDKLTPEDREMVEDYIRNNYDYNETRIDVDLDELINSIANFGGDPYMVETDEQAQELLESINATASLRKIVRGDEDFETYMKRLDLTDENRPAAIYSGVDGSEFCFIYANDYEIR